MTKGWHSETGRHALAARGIRTSRQDVAFIKSLQDKGTVGWDFKHIIRRGKAIQAIDDGGNIIGYLHYVKRGKGIELSAIDVNPEYVDYESYDYSGHLTGDRITVGFALMDEFLYKIPYDTTIYYLPSGEDFDIVEKYIQDEDKQERIKELNDHFFYEGNYSQTEKNRILDAAEKKHRNW